ncbi:acyltransferase family protein [Rhodococcus ruber]|uniref:acyltransferase family protein n=1 Tax=Rhodococcus ruber TaxID=1830 RepID=UPI003D0B7CEB
MSVVGNPVSGPVVTGGSAVPRFAHIDAMRAAAVILVVLAHGGLGDVIPGGSGVTVFFTISGFIITFLVLRERDKTSAFAIGPFYYRRVLKIVPPLLIAIARFSQ